MPRLLHLFLASSIYPYPVYHPFVPAIHILIWHAPRYYVQLCQPKCQIYEKTEYFEFATTVLKPNLFYLINLFGINNIILQVKDEYKISNEARQRHITEKLQNFGTWNCGTLQRVFFSD